jgi:hypothetical protein
LLCPACTAVSTAGTVCCLAAVPKPADLDQDQHTGFVYNKAVKPPVLHSKVSIASASAEELSAIEAAVKQLEHAAALGKALPTGRQQQLASPANLRNRAHASTMAPRPTAATAVSTAGREAATAGETAAAAEADDMSPEAVVASLQATIAALESAGPDAMSDPEVQAVLAEAGNIIADMEEQDKPQADLAGNARTGMHARMQETDVDGSMQDMAAQQEPVLAAPRQHKHAAHLQAASRLSRHPADDNAAWVKVQAEPMQEDFGSAQDTMHGAARASAVAKSQQKVSTHAVEEPEDSEEVKQVLAELEALVSTAEAAAGITHHA